MIVVNRVFTKLFNKNVIDITKLCHNYSGFDLASVMVENQRD